MSEQRAWTRVVLTLAVPLFLALGCGPSSSVHGGGQATQGVSFGFDLVCDVNTQTAAGEFLLRDHETKMTLHGTAQPGLPEGYYCGEPGENPLGNYMLDYRLKGDEVAGTAHVWINEEAIHINVEDGPLAGYNGMWAVEKGNISFEPEE
jgi:hypothetical protein